MKKVQTRRTRRAGISSAVCLALAAGSLWAAGARAAPWPHDDLTLEVPVDIRNYSARHGALVAFPPPGSEPRDPRRARVQVVCKVYRGGFDVAQASAETEMRNVTPIPDRPPPTGYEVYYAPLRTVLRVRFRNVRGVERYRCELFIDGGKRCGSGQTCEVTGELPARLTGPAARKAGEAARKGVEGLGGIRGGGGFAPGR